MEGEKKNLQCPAQCPSPPAEEREREVFEFGAF